MAVQANRPPTKRTPAAVQADSNRAVWSASISMSPTMSATVGSSGLPSGSGNSGRVPLLFSANSIQARTSGESTVKSAVDSALLEAEIVEAAGVGQGHRLPGHRQRRVHAVRLQHGDPDQRRIPVDMVDAGIEIEVVRTLDNPEGETAPFQRSRDVDNVFTRVFGGHLAVMNGLEFNIGGVRRWFA